MKSEPTVFNGQIVGTDVKIDTLAWFEFLETNNSFVYSSNNLVFRVRKNHKYWQAYKKHQGALRQKYLGRSSRVTSSKLEGFVTELLYPVQSDRIEYETKPARIFWNSEEIGIVTVLVCEGSRLIDVGDLACLGLQVIE